ncbi:Uncharacterised protein [Salmonella enterica subsp. salamae]|uniref:Uncharacterized protein n=1 Tax=Salmonella enterica subsp. salamae TaxID=59202 RepID=A0A6D2GB14_SALER|nr:Uncharacterised protein [Salmonella enterica subsp. salamae]
MEWAALGVKTRGDVALQQRRDLRGTGKHHPAYTRIGGKLGADGFSPSRQQLHDARRYARFKQNSDALGGNQRCLLCRFRQNAVACRQRGGDLAGENGQREVPRTDADHRP